MLTRYNRKTSKLRRFGTCPICHRDTTLNRDHCHTTGLTRDPICGNCNRGLGCFHDNPTHLRNAALYLERHVQLHQQYTERA